MRKPNDGYRQIDRNVWLQQQTQDTSTEDTLEVGRGYDSHIAAHKHVDSFLEETNTAARTWLRWIKEPYGNSVRIEAVPAVDHARTVGTIDDEGGNPDHPRQPSRTQRGDADQHATASNQSAPVLHESLMEAHADKCKGGRKSVLSRSSRPAT